MGEFDLVSGITIYPAGHQDQDSLEYTRVHETAHRRLASSTIWGHVQMLLALVMEKKPVRLPWVSDAQSVLETVLEASWTVDEGYAVFCEFDFQSRRQIAASPPSLPARYREAYEETAAAVATIPESFKGFEFFLVRGLAEAALNSRILEIAPFDREFPAQVREGIRHPHFHPRKRFHRLGRALAKRQFSEELGLELGGFIRERAAQLGIFRELEDPVAIYRAASLHATDLNLRLGEELDGWITPLIEGEIRKICPELDVLSISEVGFARIRHQEEAEAFATASGLSLPRLRVPNMAEKALEIASMSMATVHEMPIRILWGANTADLELRELVGSGHGFIVIATPLVEAPGGERGSTLLIAPLAPTPEIPGGWKFVGERLLAVGTITQVSQWWRMLGSNVAIGIHSFAPSAENWAPDPGLREMGIFPLVVCPFDSGRDLMGVLKMWLEIGIREVNPVAPAPGPATYFVFRLVTGLDVLCRLSQVFIGVMQVHYPEIIRPVEKLFKKLTKEGGTNEFWAMLTASDQNGVFSPLSSFIKAEDLMDDNSNPITS